MSKTNDERIIKLKKQIENKKEVLKTKNTRFAPITNCILEINGNRYNIHALNKQELVPLLVKLTSHLNTAKNLGVLDDYVIRNFNISDWVSDLTSKLENIKVQEEINELKALENKLTKMLSTDKQAELELDRIEDLLK